MRVLNLCQAYALPGPQGLEGGRTLGQATPRFGPAQPAGPNLRPEISFAQIPIQCSLAPGATGLTGQ